MISWEQLRVFDGLPPEHQLSRSERNEMLYAQFRQDYPNISKYILENVLIDDIILADNKFPYLVDEGISHMVLWSRNNIDIDSARAFICAQLTCDPGEIILFQNKRTNQSVPDIYHYQVFKKN